MALKFAKLTRPAIRSLEKGQSLTEHGITALCQASGDLRYSINIMVDGQRIHRVIGRQSEGVTREQAENAIESFRTKAREERLDLPTRKKTHRTFAKAAAEYLDRLTATTGQGQKGFKDLPNKRRHIGQYLSPYFGSKRADQISSFLVQHYTRHRLDSGAKQATVNRELSTLSHMMSHFVEWKWIKEGDRPKIKKGEEPRKKIVVLTDDTAAALYNGAVADQDGSTWLFVIIGLNSAMRHSEILRIKWDDIDFDQRRIHLEEAKAGQRTQPISESLTKILLQERDQREDKKGWLFPTQSAGAKHPYRRTMHRQFERAAIRAGLDPAKVTPHVMRHTGITRLVKAGIDLPTIQKISGHKTLAMVLRYAHMDDKHIDKAMSAIDTGKLGTITPELHTGTIGDNSDGPNLAVINGDKA
ncbi:tyrosine-type recombinase/integrase [Parasphingorhabdus sp.]|uniref:tyrosine-type recombinase/integrase n=1 Tax=Parasphingorhabdus sp. TaxID=2709688 RepID=UPI003A945F81